jgi:gliding motility-associated-like protein
LNSQLLTSILHIRVWAVCFFTIVSGYTGFAQICTIHTSSTGVCAGTTVNLSVNIVGGGTPTVYAWDFGDGFTSAASAPNHIYLTPGTYTPTLTITFSGGASCNSSGQAIQVFALPIAKYSITSADTLCFKGNNLCIVDQSTPGSSNAPLKRRLFQLNNGYFQTENAPYADTICYQNATNIFGFAYSMVLEVTDSNNCSSRLQKDSVILLPKRQPVTFNASYLPSCITTNVDFTNTSAFPAGTVRNFLWDFGDGLFDNTNWATTSHLYTANGLFHPALYVTDTFGCTDKMIYPGAIRNMYIDSNIYIYTTDKSCYKKNEFFFVSHNGEGIISWTAYDTANNIFATAVSTVGSDTFKVIYPTCGLYRVNMDVQYPNCHSNTDTFVTVYGPQAIIQNDSNRVVNRSQCQINDTVFFKTPVPYLSCQYANLGMDHLWNFDDPFAPPCTTDTRNGINVNVNCNFSKDSMNIKHAYTPGQERCYSPSLYMKDPVRGCEDADTISLGLTAPSAHWDSTVTPVRRGLYTKNSVQKLCLDQAIRFLFDETLPKCGYEKIWLNFDSACGADRWVLVDTVNKGFHNYTYQQTCDSSGFVTVGLIVQNGLDASGNVCRDTAWYHQMFRMSPIMPYIIPEILPGCAPYTATFTPLDSIQKRILKVSWDFNVDKPDLHDTVVQYLGTNDSIIHSQTHVFPSSGFYRVSTSFMNEDSCERINVAAIAFGYASKILAPDTVFCITDSVPLYGRVRYLSSFFIDGEFPVDYWSDPARAAANKEKIWWNMGDGKGFVQAGSSPKVKYDKPGKYVITMAMQDSMGCRDTVVLKDHIHIVDVFANIKKLQSTYYCAPQIVLFNDSTFVIDSVGSTTTSTFETVKDWLWDFGDGTPTSILKNPAHNYTSNGVFNMTMFVETYSGCKDSASVIVDMKGPRPLFTIVDTMGCEPFTAQFINTTGKPLQSWTWYFGDPANQTMFTTTDSPTTFRYQNAGVYNVKLLGIEDVFNPGTGNTTTCLSFFPDSVLGFPSRKVYVLGTPPIAILAKDSICPNQAVDFTVAGDTLYSTFNWTFGDGNAESNARPDTIMSHIFKDAGTYTITLIPVTSNGYECIDTATKVVSVAAVNADFELDDSKAPFYTFTNNSNHAVRYVWDFGKPSAGAGNQSTEVDAAYSYAGDTGIFTICLMAFNEDDCWDSICKQTKPETRIIIPNVFTPDNNDNKNDAFDIDIVGFTTYKIHIYNRWGATVFKSETDGIRNDGINWNGKVQNDGALCPAGVYYFIFTYKLITEETEKTVHGTVTLIRDK